MYLFYVGTYSVRGSRGVYEVTYDQAFAIGKTAMADNPSYLAKSQDGKYIYAALETGKLNGQYGGGVTAFDADSFAAISEQYTGGTAPCHISLSHDEKWLFAANYGDGRVSVFPLNGGEIEPRAQLIHHEGSGPNKGRQAGSHAHCVMPIPDADMLCAVDLGIDQAIIYDITADGLSQKTELRLPPGTGPRHVAFTKDGARCFINGEMGNDVYAFDVKTGSITCAQPTLPEGVEINSSTAAIKLSPDEKYLYVSNRGHDSIAWFAVNGDKFELMGCVPVEGKTPRDIAITHDGRYMFAANQDDDTITAFKLIDGKPIYEARLNIPAPVAILMK